MVNGVPQSNPPVFDSFESPIPTYPVNIVRPEQRPLQLFMNIGDCLVGEVRHG
jgi:hypothetical protein